MKTTNSSTNDATHSPTGTRKSTGAFHTQQKPTPFSNSTLNFAPVDVSSAVAGDLGKALSEPKKPFGTFTADTESLPAPPAGTELTPATPQKTKRLAWRVDLKKYTEHGPIAASVLMVAVFGFVAVIERGGKSSSNRSQSSVTHPLGEAPFLLPSNVPDDFDSGLSRSPHRGWLLRTNNSLDFADDWTANFDGADAPEILSDSERDRLEQELRGILIRKGHLQIPKQPQATLDDLRLEVAATASHIARFLDE
jgi:hypothetical protein